MTAMENLDLIDHYRTTRYYRRAARMKAIIWHMQKLGMIVPNCMFREVKKVEEMNIYFYQ